MATSRISFKSEIIIFILSHPPLKIIHRILIIFKNNFCFFSFNTKIKNIDNILCWKNKESEVTLAHYTLGNKPPC